MILRKDNESVYSEFLILYRVEKYWRMHATMKVAMINPITLKIPT
tara:strand:- start:371 stop:505 length:135 start_codon:yes stop_codon:yes gene_type:complete